MLCRWDTFRYSLECDFWFYVENDYKLCTQGKELGEPQEKKVRTLLEDEEEDEEGPDEAPEEVIYLLFIIP